MWGGGAVGVGWHWIKAVDKPLTHVRTPSWRWRLKEIQNETFVPLRGLNTHCFSSDKVLLSHLCMTRLCLSEDAEAADDRKITICYSVYALAAWRRLPTVCFLLLLCVTWDEGGAKRCWRCSLSLRSYYKFVKLIQWRMKRRTAKASADALTQAAASWQRRLWAWAGQNLKLKQITK